MKIIKLFLIVLTIGAIYTVVKECSPEGVVSCPGCDEPPPRRDPTKYIKKQIDSLEGSPSSTFQKDLYKTIVYDINLNLKDNKNTFLKRAYSIYANKFIEKSRSVFDAGTWQRDDTDFIKTEVKELMASNFLENPSDMNSALSKISKCMTDFDSIKKFISLTAFESGNDGKNQSLIDYKFPFDKLNIKISRVDSFRSLVADSPYLNNNTQLKVGLENVKKRGITMYENYVENKITDHLERYEEVNAGYNFFLEEYIKPLIDVIQNFKDHCIDNGYNYNVDKINRTQKKLDDMAKAAYNLLP